MVYYLVNKNMSIILEANTFIPSRCIFSKIDGDFNILALFFLTCRTSLFECRTGKDNTLLIVLYSKASLLVKNILSL